MATGQTMDIQKIIKEIGRGKLHARHLDLASARELYQAILAGDVDDMSLGAILIALRIKGEGEEELLGFYQALKNFLPQWEAIDNAIVIPSYNGARRQPNLTPLLALLLQKFGFNVFVHGIHRDTTRVTTEDLFTALGINKAANVAEAYQTLLETGLSFITIDTLCPPLAEQLDLRWHLGLRNSAHTLAKLISPFAEGQGLRLTSVSHPEYLPKVTQFFLDIQATALVSNGCEGEVYANPQRPSAIHFIDPVQHQVNELVARASQGSALTITRDCESTCRWIQQVLAQEVIMPESIRVQIAACLVVSGRCASLSVALQWIEEQGF